MASTHVRRTLALNILLAILSIIINAQAQDIPHIKIQAFNPRGVRAYIHDTPNLDLFEIHGNVNKPIQFGDVGTLAGEVYTATAGKWVIEDTELQLKVGDVINYYVFVSFETVGYLNSNRNYLKGNLTYTVNEFDELNSPGFSNAPNLSPCEYTLTKIYGGRTACAGQTIFEDNFDYLREDLWLIEHSIPIHHNDEPFVSYQRLSTNPTVTVKNGNLRIAPTPQQNVAGYNEESITSGTLDLLNGCTSELKTCYKTATENDILPPIVSGRITSNNFAFKYGTIYVRAKVPLGDWLYPELLLEPLHRYKYGRSKFASGVMKIACARGNMYVNTTEHFSGNNILYGGLLVDNTCRNTHLYNIKSPYGSQWGDQFHVYSLRWDPDGITLGKDGKRWASVKPKTAKLVDKFSKNCTNVQSEWLGYQHGSKLAPFDDYFYIALGVAAGGTTEFLDNSHTGIAKHPKPWSNKDSDGMIKFWKDMNNWFSSWKQPELIIDYVRVDAL